jgi:hypothetical protein
MFSDCSSNLSFTLNVVLVSRVRTKLQTTKAKAITKSRVQHTPGISMFIIVSSGRLIVHVLLGLHATGALNMHAATPVHSSAFRV